METRGIKTGGGWHEGKGDGKRVARVKRRGGGVEGGGGGGTRNKKI